MISYFLQIFTPGAGRAERAGAAALPAEAARGSAQPAAPLQLRAASALQLKPCRRKRFRRIIEPFTFSFCKNTRFSVSRAVVVIFFPLSLFFCVLLLPLFLFLTKKFTLHKSFKRCYQLTSQINRFSANTGYT